MASKFSEPEQTIRLRVLVSTSLFTKRRRKKSNGVKEKAAASQSKEDIKTCSGVSTRALKPDTPQLRAARERKCRVKRLFAGRLARNRYRWRCFSRLPRKQPQDPAGRLPSNSVISCADARPGSAPLITASFSTIACSVGRPLATAC